MYKEQFECLNPFTNTYATFDYEDTSATIEDCGFYNEVFFDCCVKEKEFLSGSYKIYILDSINKNIVQTINLTPKLFDGSYPSTNEIMFSGEDGTKASFMIHNSYLLNSIVYVNYKSYGAVCQGKTSKIFESSDLIGMISFKNKEISNNYYVSKCDGSSYNKEIFNEFYNQFKGIWNETTSVSYLPNFIGSFPRSIGISNNEYSNYYKGTPFFTNIQRIPKIKWLNDLIEPHSHSHTRFYGGSSKDNCCASDSRQGHYTGQYNTGTTTITIDLTDWNNISFDNEINKTEYNWSNKFEPDNIECIPYVRLK